MPSWNVRAMGVPVHTLTVAIHERTKGYECESYASKEGIEGGFLFFAKDGNDENIGAYN